MPFQIPKSCRHTQIGLWNWMDMKHSELWNTSAQIPLSTKASLETTLEACTMNPSMEGTYILWMFLGLTILSRHLFPTVAHRCHLKTLKASLEPGSTAHLLSEPWSVKAGSRWRQSKGVKYEPIWTNMDQCGPISSNTYRPISAICLIELEHWTPPLLSWWRHWIGRQKRLWSNLQSQCLACLQLQNMSMHHGCMISWGGSRMF